MSLLLLPWLLLAVIGINSQSRFTATVADQSNVDFPNVDDSSLSNDAGDAHANREAIDARGQDAIHAQVINGDSTAALTAHLEGTNWSDRADFSNADRVVSGVSVANGASETLRDDERTYDVYRVVTSYDSAPNGDADNVIVDFAFQGHR